TKVKVGTPGCLCPLYATILQQMRFRQAGIGVGARPKHIPAPGTKANEHLSGNRLALKFCQVHNSTAFPGKEAQHLLVMFLLMDEEVVTFTGTLQEGI